MEAVILALPFVVLRSKRLCADSSDFPTLRTSRFTESPDSSKFFSSKNPVFSKIINVQILIADGRSKSNLTVGSRLICVLENSRKRNLYQGYQNKIHIVRQNLDSD
uniref:Uncharacterized protein n=1 Tax=Romanomermis culicivorax TaxID=13658 RepID=A0A915INQ7_ROMCU